MKRIRQQAQPLPAVATLAVAILVITLSLAAVPAQAQVPTPTILYGFQNAPTDARTPYGNMAQGRDGNLYGTGLNAGANNTGGVWRITPSGTETVLVFFPSTYVNCKGLTLGMDGNFYGICTNGGTHNGGLIYRVTPAGVLTDLHDFDFSAQDCCPLAPPVLGTDGNFYGSTGDPNAGADNIYRITPAGVYKNLKTLSGGYSIPSTVHFGSDGNLYGTTQTAPVFGNRGAVVRITTAGAIKTVYGFVDTTGSFPNSGVIQGTDGKLYGTTSFGAANGNGGIYKVTTGGAFTLLHSTDNPTGPANWNDLLQATNGNFFGAAEGGGSGNMGGLYELTSAGVFSSFLFTNQNATGSQPFAPLMQHTNGTVFGTNSVGGSPFPTAGTFFSLNIGAAPFISLVSPIPAGKLGSQIGILGQGFSSSSVVKFGGTTATTKTLTGTTFILATVPAGAHTGTVTVTTGTSTLTSTKTFKVTPVITSFTPAAGPPGTSVMISGTELSQASAVTFGGVKATTFTVNSDILVTATVPATGKTGKIAITTPGGSASSPKTFTVN